MLIQIAIVLAFDWWQIPVNIIVLILAGWQIVPALLVVLLILDATASLYEKSSEPISSFTYNWQRGRKRKIYFSFSTERTNFKFYL